MSCLWKEGERNDHHKCAVRFGGCGEVGTFEHGEGITIVSIPIRLPLPSQS